MPVDYINSSAGCFPISVAMVTAIVPPPWCIVQASWLIKYRKLQFLWGSTHLISENHEMLLKQSDIQQPHTSDFNDARMLLAVVWPRIILAIMKRAFRPRREDTVSYEASGRNNKLCGDYHLCTVRSTFCWDCETAVMTEARQIHWCRYQERYLRV